MAKKSTLEEITKVVVEMNEKLGLSPAIVTEGATKESLRAELKLNATEMVSADKKLFSPESWNFLAAEGMLDHLPKVDQTKEVTPVVEVKKEVPKTGKPAKNETPKEAKAPAPKPESKPEKTPVAPKPPKTEKTAKVTRHAVLAKSIADKKKHTMDELVDTMVKEFGGSKREAFYQIDNHFKLLVIMGIMENCCEGTYRLL